MTNHGARRVIISVMKKKYLNLPNCITALRLVASIALIFIEPMSTAFIVIYTIGGLTDAIDGFLARKMGLVSDFGSKLDSVADLSFYAVMLIKIFPFLFKQLPVIIWYFVAGIIVFRIIMYVMNAILGGEMLTSHHYLNKASGAMLFCLPYFVGWQFLEYYSWAIIGIVYVAGIYEFTYSLYYRYLKDKLWTKKK